LFDSGTALNVRRRNSRLYEPNYVSALGPSALSIATTVITNNASDLLFRNSAISMKNIEAKNKSRHRILGWEEWRRCGTALSRGRRMRVATPPASLSRSPFLCAAIWRLRAVR
jgi:hypothetical protein